MDDFSIDMKNMLVRPFSYHLMLMIYVKYFEIIHQYRFLNPVDMFEILILKDY